MVSQSVTCASSGDLQRLVSDEQTARYMECIVPEEVEFRRIARAAHSEIAAVQAAMAVRRAAPTTKLRPEVIDGYVAMYRDRTAIPENLLAAPSRAPVQDKKHSPQPKHRPPPTLAPLPSHVHRRPSDAPSTNRSVASTAVPEDLVAEIRRKAELALQERHRREPEVGGYILSWGGDAAQKPSTLVAAATYHTTPLRNSTETGRVLSATVGVATDEFRDDEEVLREFYAAQTDADALQ